MIKRILLAWIVLSLVAAPVFGGITTLTADQDNSMYSEDGGLSNGAGAFLFAGQTAIPDLRRALVRFDLSGIPGGATITSATLDLWCNQSPFGNPGPHDFAVHRLTDDWGEAGSDAGDPGGLGAAADAGDATWTERFFGMAMPWGTTGGDFVGTASASTSIGGCTAATPVNASFTSADLIADVQAWVDGSPNHGWIVLGDESELQAARRFASRENSNDVLVPKLTVDFEVGGDGGDGGDGGQVPASSPVGMLLLILLFVGGSAFALRRRARQS